MCAGIFAAVAASGFMTAARAANYDFTGEQDSSWGTAMNWRLENGGAQQTSVPNGEHNLNFRDCALINDTFKTNPVVNINGNYSTAWKLHVRNLGTESAPVVFRADTDSHGVRAGHPSNSSGWCIGYDEGDAWLRLEKGTYDTGAGGLWTVGGETSQGHVVACSGVTMGCSQEFQLRCGSLEADGMALTVSGVSRFGLRGGGFTSILKNGGAWILSSNVHVANAAGAEAALRQDGGTLNVAGSLYVGNPGAGTLTLGSGTISVAGATFIGRGADGTGTVTVDGGEFNAGGDIRISCNDDDGGAGAGSLTVNGGRVTVAADKWTAFYTSGRITLGGGRLTTPSVALASGATGGTVEFDGGTLAANRETAAGLIRAGITVTVREGGGTVDADGRSVTVAVPLLGDPESAGGGMSFVGGGTVSLAGGNTYTGVTTVEAGTTLLVPARADLGGGLAVAFRGSAPYDAVNTLVTLTGGAETFTEADIAGVAVPDGCVLRLGDGGRSVQLVVPSVWTGAKDGNLDDGENWSGGAVPDGTACFFGSCAGAGLTNPEGGGFRPASITFLPGAPAVKISGAAVSGVAAITNLSPETCVFECPVAFAGGILVVQNAKAWDSRSRSSVRFAGGVTGAAFAEGTGRFLNGAYSVAEGSGWAADTYQNDTRWGIAGGSSLTVPETGDLHELALGNPATAGGALTTGVLRTSARLCVYNYGDYVVTDRLEVTFPGADIYACYEGSSGDYRFEKVVLGDRGSSKWFYIGASNAGGGAAARNVWFGAGGLDFADGAAMSTAVAFGRESGDRTLVGAWHSDYVLRTKSGSSKDVILMGERVVFNTTDESGVARTVTSDAVIYGSAAMHIDGSGRFVCNAVNLYSGAVTVNSGATLAVNAGRRVTTGAITVSNGAALEVAGSGAAAPGGGLDLKGGSTLRFRFTQRRSAPVLDMSGGTVTFGGGGIQEGE